VDVHTILLARGVGCARLISGYSGAVQRAAAHVPLAGVAAKGEKALGDSSAQCVKLFQRWHIDKS